MKKLAHVLLVVWLLLLLPALLLAVCGVLGLYDAHTPLDEIDSYRAVYVLFTCVLVPVMGVLCFGIVKTRR